MYQNNRISNQTFQTRIKKVKKLINFGVKKTGNKILQFFASFVYFIDIK